MLEDNDTYDVMLRQAKEGEETVFDVARKMLGEGDDARDRVEVAVQRRKLNPEAPVLAVKDRSPRRVHEFFDVPGFCAYLSKYGTDHTVVLADAVGETVTAVLDEQAPDGFELMTFRPQVHPLFAPWLRLLKASAAEPLGIKSFVEFVIGERRAVYDPEPKGLIMMLQQLRMSRKVEVFQGIGKHSLNGVTVVTDIGAGKTQNDLLELPDSLAIDVPLYVGLPTTQVSLDLILGGDEDGVCVKVVSSEVATARVAAFEEFCTLISTTLFGTTLDAARFTVALGRPKHEAWAVLRT